MPLVFDTRELDPLIDLLHRRATSMVTEAVAEGTQRAESYAQTGGRRRNPATRRYHARFGAIRRRTRHATGSQIVRMIERVLYRRFIDFFGSW